MRLWSLLCKKRRGQAGESPKDWEAARWRKAETTGFIQPWERLRGDLVPMFQHLKGGYKEDGDSPFTRSHTEKTGSEYKLLLGRLQLDTRTASLANQCVPSTGLLRFSWTGCWAKSTSANPWISVHTSFFHLFHWEGVYWEQVAFTPCKAAGWGLPGQGAGSCTHLENHRFVLVGKAL